MGDYVDGVKFIFDGSNWSGSDGLGTQLVEQLLLTVTSLAIVLVVGLPIALWLGHIGKGGTFAINLTNVGRAIPVFAVLGLLSVGMPSGSATFGPYGRAGLATLIALVLFGLPPIVTNSYVGMREVDRDIVEAARGMGMTEFAIFKDVELPLVRPLIMNGIRLAMVQIWATATIAALVAGPGLGNTITYGYTNGLLKYVIGGAILVAAIALVLEGILALIEHAVDPMRSVGAVRNNVRPTQTTSEPEGATT